MGCARTTSADLWNTTAPRAGFFERSQVNDVAAHLSPELAAVVRFAFISGWRIDSEVLPLEWRNVDFKTGEVRIDAGATKNNDGRVIKMTAELREVLTTRHTLVEELKRTRGLIVPLVFFRMVAKGRRGEKFPKPIKRWNKAWKNACIAAGCPGRIPHDFRRSAVRTFVRAGISEKVAMSMSGHRTASVFKRYDIVSEGDLTDAAAKLDAAANRDSSVTVVPKRPRRQFGAKRIS
jgi:integrase